MSSNSYIRSLLPGNTEKQKINILKRHIIRFLAEKVGETSDRQQIATAFGYNPKTAHLRQTYMFKAFAALEKEGLIEFGTRRVILTSKGMDAYDSGINETPRAPYPVHASGPALKVVPELIKVASISHPQLLPAFPHMELSMDTKAVRAVLALVPDVMKMDRADIAIALEKLFMKTYGKRVDIILTRVAHELTSPAPIQEPLLKEEPKKREFATPYDRIMAAVADFMPLEELNQLRLEKDGFGILVYKTTKTTDVVKPS